MNNILRCKQTLDKKLSLCQSVLKSNTISNLLMKSNETDLSKCIEVSFDLPPPVPLLPIKFDYESEPVRFIPNTNILYFEK